MKVLFLGDVFGNPGRSCLKEELPRLLEKYEPHIVIANGENASGGIGINPGSADFLFSIGVDVLTSGNHIYKKRDIYDYIKNVPRLLKACKFSTRYTRQWILHIPEPKNSRQKNSRGQYLRQGIY